MKKPIPHSFVLDELADLGPLTKPMFGAFSVYVDGAIVFILRDRESSPADNGVWLATSHEHHESLKSEFPNMRSIALFEKESTGWQVLPSDADDFEESVLRACNLVRRRDPRIGKIPKTKLRRTKKSKRVEAKKVVRKKKAKRKMR